MPKPGPDLVCSVASTLDVVGDRWTMLVIRDALYGLRRFDEFQRDLGIARNVLTTRLQRLVENGVLEKVLYQEHPPRHEYHLTQKGRDLLPVVLTMMNWGQRYEAEDDGPPPQLHHLACGGTDVKATIVCSSCGDELHLHEIVTDPVPVHGARRLPELLSAGAVPGGDATEG